MQIYYLLYILLIKIIISIDSDSIKEQLESNILLKSIIQSYLSSNYSIIDNLSLSEQCISKLNNTYYITKNLYDDNVEKNRNDTKISLYYYNKLFAYSSKNKNDFGVPEMCDIINEKDSKFISLKEELMYILVSIENEESYYDILTNNNSNLYNNLIGLCIVKGCEADDYIKLINNIINYINNSQNNKNGEISIYYKNNYLNEKFYFKIVKLIPLIFISFHLIFVIFNKLPLYLYNFILCIFCCKCKKEEKKGNIKIKRILSKDKGQLVPKDANNSLNNISTSSINSNIDKIELVNLLYNIDKNFEALMEYNKQNEYFNDIGLTYINGIKGISMIFFLFGNVYIALYNSPLLEINSNILYNNLKSIRYFVFYFGIKYAPKLLICCSGFTLFYKFNCFLDDNVESEKEIKKQREEINKNEDSNDNEDKNKSNKRKKSTGFNFNSLVSIKYLFIFFGYQLHKYILYLLSISFFLFSFYEVISFFHGEGPILNYFQKNIVEPSYKIQNIFFLLFGFQGYLLPFIRNDKNNILNYFNIVYQEIFYFIISTIILFVGYKKNLKIDKFFRITILILFIGRLLFYFISGFINIRNYFSFQSYGQFYTSIIYNYIYYLIGIYFGMFNYIIQKRYLYMECIKNKKSYLINCVKIIEIIKKRKKYPYFLGIIFILILFLNTFSQQILLYIFGLTNNSMKESMISYNKSIYVELFMIVDTDIVILGINIISLILYLKGNNIINNFINHNFWSILSKFYFSYILLINPIILYVVYISESKIKFDINNCFLYTFICGILVFALTCFIFIVFELPYKKPIRYLFKLSKKVINDERFNNIENTFNYNQIENQGELIEDSNSDEDDDVDDDEDEDDFEN